ncbi:MAG: hypothetical protein R3B51_05530 [Thermodesulfobacteriota bacterium]
MPILPYLLAPESEEVAPAEALERAVAYIICSAGLAESRGVSADYPADPGAVFCREISRLHDEEFLAARETELFEVAPVLVSEARHIDEVGACAELDDERRIEREELTLELFGPGLPGSLALERGDSPRGIYVLIDCNLGNVGDGELERRRHKHEGQRQEQIFPVRAGESVKPLNYLEVVGFFAPSGLFDFRNSQCLFSRPPRKCSVLKD